jgi:hypothetical protein
MVPIFHPGFVLFVSLFISGIASAADTDQNASDRLKANIFEVFVGGTFYDDAANASVGALYLRRLNEKFGIGVVAEYTESDDRGWVFALPVVFHITEPIKIKIAPGVEYTDGNTEYLTRLGASYEFGFTGWSLAPELIVDFVGGEVKTVVGVAFGWHFD